MRQQPRLIFCLLALMCAIRFGLAAYGYALPEPLMASLGAAPEANLQMPYMVRVWAVRDMVLALLVLFSTPASLRPLLYACVAIDGTDVLSALLAGQSGAFDSCHTLGLMSTAFAALIPEVIALLLMRRRG